MRQLFTLLLLLIPFFTYAQRHDNIWFFGGGGGAQSLPNDSFGISILNFGEYDSPLIEVNQEYTVNFYGINTTVCDSNGLLQFYTNGVRVYNTNHVYMSNGDGLVSNGASDGYRLPQSVSAMPYPGHPGQYILIAIEDFNNDAVGHKLFYHIIDMHAENGLGKVILKRQLLVQDSLTWGQIAAVKHANGRDWWFIVARNDSNEYYIGSITPSGVQVRLDTVGDKILTGGGAVCFSPDGRYHIRADSKGAIYPVTVNIFDFDRCSGVLSHQRRHSLYNPQHFVIGTVVSPDSRYLYVTDDRIVYQYDLQAPDVFATETVVAEWDGFKYAGIWPTDFYQGQNGPDGRIYVNTSNSSRSMHRIRFPNRKGKACQFVQNDMKYFTSFRYEMPNHPNYRLGPLDGSSCDTLGIDNLPLAAWRWEQEYDSLPLRISFSDFSYYAPEQWYWDFGDGQVSQDTSPVHVYAQSGIYEVCLVVQNTYGADTLCRLVNVEVSSVNDAQEQPFEVSAWPNPFSRELVLSPEGGGVDYVRAEAQLYDVQGRLVARERWQGPQLRWDLSGLPPGLYLYTVRTDRGRVFWGKAVKY
ncbi:MAG: PKD domain-containing protein [Chitinophagales bacterium]|nr:PKD domain-containing protein [Chitinophagales bacterium]